MKLLIGLGNPGAEYSTHRHNIGFMVIDSLNHHFGHDQSFQKEHKALTSTIHFASQKIKLVKPQTYMNLSGESVLSLLNYYNLTHEDLVVVHDDIDQGFGCIRFQKSRGHGGHNGIRNIHALLGSNDYIRLKMGVGRPSHPKMDVASYVLQDFSKMEMEILPDFLSLAMEVLECLFENGFEKAASLYNNKSVR